MKMLMKSVFAAVGVAIATPAMASTLTLDNLSVGLGRTVQTNMTSGTYHAGQLNWTVAAMSGNAANMTGLSVGDSVSTFCTQLVQTAQSPTVFNLVQVQDAPQPGAGMGAARASFVNGLYSNFYSQAFQSNTHAAAFQLAIWEIVHESDSAIANQTLDVSSGDFRATGGSVFNIESGIGISAVGLANSWLNTILGLSDMGSFDILALSSSGAQDQIIMVNPIPLPAPLLLGGLGLLLVPALRRRLSA